MARVATVTIGRPDRGNALDVATCQRLMAELASEVEGGSRAIVLAGERRRPCFGGT